MIARPQTEVSAAQRLRGERGSSMVAACVLLFTFTAGGIIWLTRDVNRSVSDRSAAQSVAFQAARAGAQQVDVGSLRVGVADAEAARINEDRARTEAMRVGRALADAYELRLAERADGRQPIWVTVVDDRVTVGVTISGTPDEITVEGSAQAQVGP